MIWFIEQTSIVFYVFCSWAAEKKSFVCKPVSQELHVGSGSATEEEVAPECGQLGGGSGAGARQKGNSRGQVSKVTGIKKLCSRDWKDDARFLQVPQLPVAGLKSETACKDLPWQYRESWGRDCFTYYMSPSRYQFPPVLEVFFNLILIIYTFRNLPCICICKRSSISVIWLALDASIQITKSIFYRLVLATGRFQSIVFFLSWSYTFFSIS